MKNAKKYVCLILTGILCLILCACADPAESFEYCIDHGDYVKAQEIYAKRIEGNYYDEQEALGYLRSMLDDAVQDYSRGIITYDEAHDILGLIDKTGLLSESAIDFYYETLGTALSSGYTGTPDAAEKDFTGYVTSADDLPENAADTLCAEAATILEDFRRANDEEWESLDYIRSAGLVIVDSEDIAGRYKNCVSVILNVFSTIDDDNPYFYKSFDYYYTVNFFNVSVSDTGVVSYSSRNKSEDIWFTVADEEETNSAYSYKYRGFASKAEAESFAIESMGAKNYNVSYMTVDD